MRAGEAFGNLSIDFEGISLHQGVMRPMRFVSVAHKTKGGRGFRITPKDDSTNAVVRVHKWLEEAMVNLRRVRRYPNGPMSEWIFLKAIHAYPKYHSAGSLESLACWV